MGNVPPAPTEATDPLQLLLSAFGATLQARRSVAEVLRDLLDLSEQLIRADAYAVWRTYDGHKTWRALATKGLSPGHRTFIRSEKAHTLSADPVVIADVADAPLLKEQQPLYEREGIKSLIILPMVIEGDISGTITFYFRARRAFAAQDLSYATALANFASGALRTSELHEENQRERRRISFLGEASSVLASSLDYELTLERVAKLAVPHIADWCTVHLVEDGQMVRVAVAHADPSQLELARRFAAEYPEEVVPDRGIGLMLRTGEAQFVPEVTIEMLALAAQDAKHLGMIRELGITSAILVPLKSRDRVLGAIRLIATGRSFTPDDLRLAESLASRAAIAVDNARLYREAVASANQLRLSHMAARMGSWSWDLASNRLHWSDEFKALHGLPPQAQPDHEAGANLTHPDDRAWVLKSLQELLDSDAAELSIEHRALAADGSVLWLHHRGKIERDINGKATALHGIAMDVTERRLTEEALRRTEKLAAAGRLAATVAHETNNPLEAVTNLVYLARHAEGAPPEVQAYLATAEQELGRISQIVRQTLGFYRETAKPVGTDLGLLVGEVVEIYKRRMEARSIDAHLVVEGDTKATMVAGEIKQVVANLVGNAMDATGERGRISMAVRGGADQVVLTIADTGHGIREEDGKRLFEPFFTTRKDVGTGLGLWVSKGIVEKHGGKISFESRSEPPAQGTTFTIALPRSGKPI